MIELIVCVGSSCHLRGSYNLVQRFQQLIEETETHDKIELKSGFCMKSCRNDGVAVSIDGEKYNVKAENARDFFREKVLQRLPQ